MRRTQGHRVIHFIESRCVHTASEWIGQPFRLLNWQKQLIMELFEVGDDGLRRYRWALLGVPKKNGKTELAAALALYFLLADNEPAPLVICAAASEEQADLVFGAARTMCEMSPALRKLTLPFEKEIQVPSLPGAKLKRVAATVGTNDGQNIHAVFGDELHEWGPPKGDNVWNVLTNGTGARKQPMVVQTTTAGYDIEGTICGKQYAYGKKVSLGEIDDPRYYFRWWEAPEKSDHRDPRVWEQANPSYGVLVHEPFFQDQLTKKTEAVFRRYFLNQWTSGSETWLPFGAWDACLAELELRSDLPLRVAVDVALRNDSTAVVCGQLQGERIVLRARVWENPYPDGHSLHDSWELNIFEVEEHLKELRAAFPTPTTEIDGRVMPGPEFCYDPAYFHRSAAILEGEGLAMVEFPQHDSRMIPASQGFYQRIVERKIAHDGDPTLARHIGNATADQKPRGWRLTKPKGSRKKIDAAVAAAIASHRALEPSPEPKRSAYEDRGLVTV
jgi:phage terminase large subunit-like protein